MYNDIHNYMLYFYQLFDILSIKNVYDTKFNLNYNLCLYKIIFILMPIY